jgi:hypothetical protein
LINIRVPQVSVRISRILYASLSRPVFRTSHAPHMIKGCDGKGEETPALPEVVYRLWFYSAARRGKGERSSESERAHRRRIVGLRGRECKSVGLVRRRHGMDMQDHDNNRADPPVFVVSSQKRNSVPSARCRLISGCRSFFCLVHFLLFITTVCQKLVVLTRFICNSAGLRFGDPDFLFLTLERGAVSSQ